MTRNDKIEALQLEIHEAREAAGRYETAEELREIVKRAHDARRAIEVIDPKGLDLVGDDIDYLYDTLLRHDPSALDEITDRVGPHEIAARKVEELTRDILDARTKLESDGFETIQRLFGYMMIAHIAATELFNLASPTGILYARKRLEDVADDLAYLYRIWKEATGERFSPDSWTRLGILGLRATAWRIKNKIKNKS